MPSLRDAAGQPPSHTPAEAAEHLRALAARWNASTLKERQAFQSWFLEFCDALGVGRPGPDHGQDYCFEKPVIRPRDTVDSTGFIDCWKAGHVAIEAKASGTSGTNEILLRRAFRQVSDYVAAEPGTVPPYLIVVDVPRELIIWDGWRGGFGGFAAGHRIALDALASNANDIALLQDILTNPSARDPRGKALEVTRDIAGKLAELAASFEDRGHDPERVARFLMRCVFCCFAEDVGLLPKELFKRTLENARSAGGPERVGAVLMSLWRTMDTGGDFGADLIQRFNGHFFQSVEALPLETGDIDLLVEAASFEWGAVEPSIFGTLLVRALSPEERHKLGAEYTPREYIERLVEPTVVEPIRERWSAVQARVVQLEAAVASTTAASAPGTRKKTPKELKEAESELLSFHAWLRSLRFLDPACGSGNFLYVTMAAVKRIELEVLSELTRLRGGQEGLVLDEVHPRQFHGIEVSWWAREIAELTLWIGYHQFWREAHGGRTPPVPILEDTGTIECRDAILAWDATVHRPEKDRPDPTPSVPNPVTGELDPDPSAKLPYTEYLGAKQATWPEADFIVGNPPYIGQARMREALGDGYVEALRGAYNEIPAGIDFVMYWWWRASTAVAAGRTKAAGLITTNSLTQKLNRRVIELTSSSGAHVTWAIPDHPWVDDSEGAAVRVAMTVQSPRQSQPVRLVTIGSEGQLTPPRTGSEFNPDLTLGIDAASAAALPLLSNVGLSSPGYKLHGSGFILESEEAAHLLIDDLYRSVVRPFRNGRDISRSPRDCYVIDFGVMPELEAREWPRALQIVQDRVRPERLSNPGEAYREKWWQFGRPRPELREALIGLDRFLATPETARHRYFVRLPATIAPDNTLRVIALSARFHSGVLNSNAHRVWSEAVGSRLGVGNDFRYNASSCFDAFPFPDPAGTLRDRIGAVAEQLDRHRADSITRDDRVTMTGMYNVVEKLRSGDNLTATERVIHEVAACGILKELHDELDALVAESYGWDWPIGRKQILEGLVALHDERLAEEKRGHIRWLRPEYQIPRFAPDRVPADLGLVDAGTSDSGLSDEAAKLFWPVTAVEQIVAIQELVGRGVNSLPRMVESFRAADPRLVARHLETLKMLGEA